MISHARLCQKVPYLCKNKVHFPFYAIFFGALYTGGQASFKAWPPVVSSAWLALYIHWIGSIGIYTAWTVDLILHTVCKWLLLSSWLRFSSSCQRLSTLSLILILTIYKIFQLFQLFLTNFTVFNFFQLF